MDFLIYIKKSMSEVICQSLSMSRMNFEIMWQKFRSKILVTFWLCRILWLLNFLLVLSTNNSILAVVSNCGASLSENNTYFESTGDEKSHCSIQVCKASSNIVQVTKIHTCAKIATVKKTKTTYKIPQNRNERQVATFSYSS